jgi:hypothetical protein
MEDAGDLLMRPYPEYKIMPWLKWSCFALHRKLSPFWTILMGLDMPIFSACRKRILRMWLKIAVITGRGIRLAYLPETRSRAASSE